LASDEPGPAFVHAAPDEVEGMTDENGKLKSQL
jgi:hypothetical protein